MTATSTRGSLAAADRDHAAALAPLRGFIRCGGAIPILGRLEGHPVLRPPILENLLELAHRLGMTEHTDDLVESSRVAGQVLRTRPAHTAINDRVANGRLVTAKDSLSVKDRHSNFLNIDAAANSSQQPRRK